MIRPQETLPDMIRRRRLLFALGAGMLAAPFADFAQQQRIYRVGYLANDPDRASPTFQAFLEAMRQLGWIEGKNIDIRYLTSNGRDERFAELAAAVVRDKVDVIVTTGSGSTRAAKAATRSIPIVFGSAANPVEQKFVASLARPGGNVTGLSLLVQELGPKRLQLLKQMLPNAARIGFLHHATAQPATADDASARSLGVTLLHIPTASADDIDAAFAKAARSGVDAVAVKADAMFVVNRERIAALALKHRLPMMCADGRFVEAGALASYGENFASRYQRAAYYVDKILRGAKPADLPVEQPMVFELVVNLKTAAALGMVIPQPILLQADRLIR